ncbi:MAG TPA: sulfotransferase, partial [Dehalococcoidia bacterium]
MSADTQPIDVVFIAGAGRSGTTLLDRLLGSTPGAYSGGELDRVWGVLDQPERLCSCGRHPRACDFWTAVLEQAFGAVTPAMAGYVAALHDRVTPIRDVYRFWLPLQPGGRQRDLAEYVDALTQLYRALATVSRA